MTPLGWLGHKTSTQTINKVSQIYHIYPKFPTKMKFWVKMGFDWTPQTPSEFSLEGVPQYIFSWRIKKKILCGYPLINVELWIFSSPEQKLRVSCCDHPLSVVVRHSSSTISLLTLWRSQFWPNLDGTCPECLPLWNLGQVRYWVIWGQKLGHQVKSKEKLVNTLEVIFLKQSSCLLLIMFAMMISRSVLKLGHLGSKTRSPGQIKGKPC